MGGGCGGENQAGAGAGRERRGSLLDSHLLALQSWPLPGPLTPLLG